MKKTNTMALLGCLTVLMLTACSSGTHSADTDRDGLSDQQEATVYGTDPTNPDTDGDGLTDGDEVVTCQSDPTVADTDGDGVNDGHEVLAGTSPVEADPLLLLITFSGESGKPRVTDPIDNVYGITVGGAVVPDLLNTVHMVDVNGCDSGCDQWKAIEEAEAGGVALDAPSGIAVVPGTNPRRV